MRHAAGAVLLAVAASVVLPANAGPEVEDLERRVRACTHCHGSDGIEIEDGYVPRIEGKPAGYLYNQLVHFRAHRRDNATMNRLVRWLSDDYLAAIAEHFAAREPPYPEPAAPPESAALRERGRTLVRKGDAGKDIPACAACHGDRLAGVKPDVPGLIGLPQHYISGQLGAWRVGRRNAAEPDCMAWIAERLGEADTEAVAAWLASRPLPDDTEPAPGPLTDPPLTCGSVQRPGSR